MSRLGSPQAGSRRVAIAKPKNDIYVALLAVALGSIVIACILLAMEMSNYDWNVNAKAQGPTRTTAPFALASSESETTTFDQGRTASIS